MMLFTCNYNKAIHENSDAETKSKPEVAANTETNQPLGDGITGYWKLMRKSQRRRGG